MKVAVLGDVHANAAALRAVLKDISAAEASHLLVAGDFVGYYYEPKAVLDELRSWSMDAVSGNHDQILCKIHSGDEEARKRYLSRYGHGLEHALDAFSQDDYAFLGQLPHVKRLRLGGKEILLCHGSPWDTDKYVYPDSPPELFERCAQEGCDIVIMGHTHHPFHRRVGRALLLNPGSVGQPRNYRPGADWCLLDLETQEVQAKHTDYDSRQLREQAAHVDPDIPYLASVLVRTQ